MRGSASPLLPATGIVNGKLQISTPPPPRSRHHSTDRETFVTDDRVGDPYGCAKFGENLSRRLMSKCVKYNQFLVYTGCAENRSTLKRYNFANFWSSINILKHDTNQNWVENNSVNVNSYSVARCSRVVSVLDSGAEGPGFKLQSRLCRVTVLGKLFTPIVPLFT